MTRPPVPLRRRRWSWVLAASALGLLIAADHAGLLLVRRPSDMTVYHGSMFRVARVVDGETLELAVVDRVGARQMTRVRLWGVDCPDLAGPDRRAEPLAEEARELARSLADGRSVVVALESHRTRGAFGCLLAHVQLAGGQTLNEALLRAGLARADDRWPHSRLERYDQLERTARHQGVGMWGESE